MYLRELSLSAAANLLPSLAGLSFEGSGVEAYARLEYVDPDGHCPVVAEIAFDGGLPYPMYPQSLGYGAPVEYRTAAGIEPLAMDSWSRAVARFSDNIADTVETEAVTTGIDDGTPPRTPSALRATISPNPFSSTTSIELETAAAERIRVEIFDARGALVRTVLSGVVSAGVKRITWDGRDAHGLPAPSGLYFCRISAPRQTFAQKLLLLK